MAAPIQEPFAKAVFLAQSTHYLFPQVKVAVSEGDYVQRVCPKGGGVVTRIVVMRYGGDVGFAP